MRGRKLNHKQLFDYKVNQEVVLLVSVAVRLAIIAVLRDVNTYLYRRTRYGAHFSACAVVTSFVFTNEDIINFVALSVDKQRRKAAVSYTRYLMFIRAVFVFGNLAIKLRDFDKHITRRVDNFLHFRPRVTIVKIAYDFGVAAGVSFTDRVVRSREGGA